MNRIALLRLMRFNRVRRELDRRCLLDFIAGRPWAKNWSIARVAIHGDLDLIANAEHTRGMLARLVAVLAPGQQDKVFVDLSQITRIEPCSLLNLFALLDQLNRRFHRISGTYPSAPEALSMFQAAGFDQFIKNVLPQEGEKPPPAHLEATKGRCEKGKAPSLRIWARLAEFVAQSRELTARERDDLTNAFGECVDNVSRHSGAAHWYVVAMGGSDRPARAVVVDLGVGIPKTVHKYRVAREQHESAGAAMSRWMRTAALGTDDYDCLVHAMRGTWTRSNDPKHGTGLDGLRIAAERNTRNKLHIISGSSQISWTGGRKSSRVILATPLMGTIVCLELAPPATGSTDE